MIQMRNVINEIIVILRHAKLNRILNYEKKNCYQTSSKNVHLIVKSKKHVFKNFFKLIFVDLIIVAMLIEIVHHSSISVAVSEIVNVRQKIFVVFNDKMSVMKIVTFRDITIYDDELTRVKLKIVTKQFFEL